MQQQGILARATFVSRFGWMISGLFGFAAMYVIGLGQIVDIAQNHRIEFAPFLMVLILSAGALPFFGLRHRNASALRVGSVWTIFILAIFLSSTSGIEVCDWLRRVALPLGFYYQTPAPIHAFNHGFGALPEYAAAAGGGLITAFVYLAHISLVLPDASSSFRRRRKLAITTLVIVGSIIIADHNGTVDASLTGFMIVLGIIDFLASTLSDQAIATSWQSSPKGPSIPTAVAVVSSATLWTTAMVVLHSSPDPLEDLKYALTFAENRVGISDSIGIAVTILVLGLAALSALVERRRSQPKYLDACRSLFLIWGVLVGLVLAGAVDQIGSVDSTTHQVILMAAGGALPPLFVGCFQDVIAMRYDHRRLLISTGASMLAWGSAPVLCAMAPEWTIVIFGALAGSSVGITLALGILGISSGLTHSLEATNDPAK